MKATKILFITQEMIPFVPETQKSLVGRYLPQAIQEMGHEIRTFTPKWGIINERRNQLHEVIRLSGMNLIIDDTDHPLIIKVSSIQAARMQIYFIDNDDYFQKRAMTTDENGKEYDDNGERAIFYARGVLETVKKLRWVPDVIHCHGWITSLAPLYIKKAYSDEPSFRDTKIVYSASAPEFANDLGQHFADCIPFKDAKKEDFAELCNGKFGHTELSKIAIKFSDGVILDNENVEPELVEYAKGLGKPLLDFQPEDVYKKAYNDFYETVVGE
ncbi:MAG: glycogen/starch synthase [Bacteroidaceae bacterium]|nr:glycogen/starch synthase [Bacteroidaceae bacterium]